MNKFKSILLTPLATIIFVCGASAQNSFVDYQKSFAKVADVFRRKEDTLRRQFEKKGLQWPAKYIYIRSFKFDSQLEVWVKSKLNEEYKLFKTYKICAMAGSLGPKRMQGDYQVPEGFYYINEFKPNSQYHLSLGLNYPNASDKMLSDSLYPGGDIYIHGSCVTEGCIPITNDQIEDLYVITSYARALGQEFIPVHIFPVQFNNTSSLAYLERFLQTYKSYRPLVGNLRAAYNYFEKKKQVPVVVLNPLGQYVLEDPGKSESLALQQNAKPRVLTNREKASPIPDDQLARSVNSQPVYPGGSQAFQTFLDETGKDLATYLDAGRKAAYLVVDYIIDQTGKPVYAKVTKGGNDELNEEIEKRFENMPQWKPAIRQEIPVAIKLKQTVLIQAAP